MNVTKLAMRSGGGVGDPQPTTLAVKVYEQLRRDIRSGALAPGSPLRTEWLKSHYETGVSPLREALARLAAESFVTAQGKQGFRVAEVSEADFDELVDIRRALEAGALEAAMANGDDDWEAEIIATYHKLIKAASPAQGADAAAEEERELRHRRFHEALIAACGSRWQLRFLNNLTSHLERYRRIMRPASQVSAGFIQDVADEHKELMERTIQRDVKGALKVLDAHRLRTYSAIKNQFATADEN